MLYYGGGGQFGYQTVEVYSERPITGRPVWQTGRKSVRILNVRFITNPPAFRQRKLPERSKSGQYCPVIGRLGN